MWRPATSRDESALQSEQLGSDLPGGDWGVGDAGGGGGGGGWGEIKMTGVIKR